MPSMTVSTCVPAVYVQGRRFSRPRGMQEYCAWVTGLQESTPGVPGSHLPPEQPEDALLDMVMLRLRTADGLDVGQVEAVFGEEAAADVRRGLALHVQRGLAVWDEDDRVVRLTDPDGFLVSNDVIADVFALLPDGGGQEAVL